MQLPLSQKVLSIEEPLTIGMSRRSRELNQQGIQVINLSLGEPDFDTPEPIKQAAIEAIQNNFSHYTAVSGYLELRQAICEKFKRDNNLHFTPDQIVVSTGAKQSIANAYIALLNPGDEVIIPAPYWVTYAEFLKLIDAKPVIVQTSIDNNFKLSAEELEKHITPKTKLIIFSSPSNPTGSVYSQQELAEWAKVLEKYPQIYVISDEIYEHINYVGKHYSLAQFESISERVIIINGVSKGYAMTGWRGGILAGPKWLAQACDKIQGQFTSATCSITQKAMHKAMEIDIETYVKPMVRTFQKRRDLVLNHLKDIKGIRANNPDGAFYVFADVTNLFGKRYKDKVIQSGTDLCFYLLDEARVSLVPGAAFGNDNYIRISYATSEELLEKAMNQIKSAIEKLQ
ncbi:MAG TPA: pyridoxal phosphate-dependent aminotransferase [Bacteroidia bacterium]|nr:pyridoxal phosphate-dependent aminotransferase [Bacteroidia bacterium]